MLRAVGNATAASSRLLEQHSPSKANEDENGDDMSEFLTVSAAMSALGLYFSWLYLWAHKEEQRQLILLRQQGSSVRGTNTIDETYTTTDVTAQSEKRAVTYVRAMYRYRVQLNHNGKVLEIAKPVLFMRYSEPEVGEVEKIDLIVLPRFPKSGIDRSTLNKHLERITPIIRRLEWSYVVCMIACPVLWILAVLHQVDDLFAVEVMAGFTALIVLWLWLVWYFRTRLQCTNKILDPKEMTGRMADGGFLTATTMSEIAPDSPGYNDPLLPPFPMTMQIGQDTEPELRPILGSS